LCTERAKARGIDVSRQEVEQLTLEFVGQLDTADTAAASNELFSRYALRLGFTNATCLRVPEPDEDLDACFLHNSYPEAWVRHYGSNGYIRQDPIVKELFLTYQPFTWSEVLERRQIGETEHKIMAECASAILPVATVRPYPHNPH
jgi:hypothetical protein